jgi:hypothetical protein
MGLVLAIGLIILGVIVGWYDRFGVQRDYADLHAARHGRIPGLADWFFTPDSDPEVDDLRRQHRNLWLLTALLGVVAFVLILVWR